MADFENKNQPDMQNADGDVISNLESLSKKYGIAFNASKYTPKDSVKAYTPPKNNTPARTPRIVYDVNNPGSSVKIVYSQDEPHGPEGRRVIYSENETESIAEKRRRNALAQKTEKGSQGFGSQPYVRHVASSQEAIKRDDKETFSRAYKENRETVSNEAKAEVHLPEAKGKLVASNPDSAKARVHQHYEKTAGEKVASFFKAFIPWKGDPAKEIARKLVMNISAILVLICFGYFVDNYIQHHNALDKDDQIKGDQIEQSSQDDLAAQWAEIKALYPDVDFPEGMNIRWAKLYAQNQDLIGWLHIDNTNIDTAVMHKPSDKDIDDSSDFEDYYLRRSFYKNYDKYGVPYLDRFNTGKKLDRNNTIYGHNMTDGLSFAQLEKYYTIEGFAQSPIIEYSTLFEDYHFFVYAAFITNGYPSGDNGYLFNYNAAKFSTNASFEKFIEAIDERKLYDTGVDINKDDKLLILSTCSYEIEKNQMGRLAVVGRLVREGESLSIDTSKAVENENIRYPQIWYDEHGLTNPYKNAYQWVP